ncbi:site-specific integrase [Nitratireductor sp. XY-223]|uniref:site-specific integrase n=1 Tax=Hyphomicrobiales TaxID=356 RepID=UPI0019817CFF|nr:site-specific integrase [Nitratireductor sp. XY-223]
MADDQAKGLADRQGRHDHAGIPDAPHRTPKGLRHGFGVNAILKNAPLNLLQKWLGHADLKTTAIYADALGQEEQQIAARMWD